MIPPQPPFGPQTTPAIIAPAAPPAVTRVRKVGFYTVCDLCGLAVDYCKGHTLPEMASSDGTDSSLNQRIAEARAKAGGR